MRTSFIIITIGLDSQYIYWDSKLLALVVCFAELVKNGLRAILAEQHATINFFLDQPGMNRMHQSKRL